MEPKQTQIPVLLNNQYCQTSCQEWGDPAASQTVICVHGLTRNSRDFDPLAAALSQEYRVLCPDILGRGNSQWLRDPEDYNYASYFAQISALMAHYRLSKLHWVGTSMGGLLGMMVAAVEGTPLEKLVISDVGPIVPLSALSLIGQYLGKSPAFSSWEEAETYLRQVHSGFGPLSDTQWRHLTRHSCRKHNGEWRLHYDPAIADNFQAVSADADFTSFWDRGHCPTLLLRGAQSELLAREQAEALAKNGRVTLVTVPDTAHAPMLMATAQIEEVKAFLRD